MNENYCPNCFSTQNDLSSLCPICEYLHQEEPSALPTQRLLQERYAIGRVLGQGGFGITYLCWDTKLKIKVAIKEFYPHQDSIATRNPHSGTVMPSNNSEKARIFVQLKASFEQEAITLAGLKHPNLVRVTNTFEDQGTAYFVMDYLEGQTLESYLKQKLPMNFEAMLDYLSPLCEAVAALHEVNLIHRDLKPANIYRTLDGRLVLLDFGSARDYTSNMSMTAMASAGYAPIEQYTRNQTQGPWTDIYALGAMAYYLLAGSVPPIATDRLLQDDLQLPKGLNELQAQWLTHALALRPENRPKDVLAWLNQVRSRIEVKTSEASQENLFVQGVIQPKLADKLLTSAEEAEIKNAAPAFGISPERTDQLIVEKLLETGSKRGEIKDETTQKICPFCAELIKAEAIRCRYCGASLTDSVSDAMQLPPLQEETSDVSYKQTPNSNSIFINSSPSNILESVKEQEQPQPEEASNTQISRKKTLLIPGITYAITIFSLPGLMSNFYLLEWMLFLCVGSTFFAIILKLGHPFKILKPVFIICLIEIGLIGTFMYFELYKNLLKFLYGGH